MQTHAHKIWPASTLIAHSDLRTWMHNHLARGGRLEYFLACLRRRLCHEGHLGACAVRHLRYDQQPRVRVAAMFLSAYGSVTIARQQVC